MGAYFSPWVMVPQEALVPQDALVPQEAFVPQEALVPQDALLPDTAVPASPGATTVEPQTVATLNPALLNQAVEKFVSTYADFSNEL